MILKNNILKLMNLWKFLSNLISMEINNNLLNFLDVKNLA